MSRALSIISSRIYPDTAVSENALLASIREHDEEALIVLYKRYSSYVFSIALRVLGNILCAEEVRQDVFMRIWTKPEWFFVEEGSLLASLSVVSRNRSIDLLRLRRPTISIEDIEVVASHDLDGRLERLLLCNKARSLIDRLPIEQRRVIVLAYFEDMTHSEIAHHTSSPLGTVKTRIRCALLTLRKGLQPIEPTGHEAR